MIAGPEWTWNSFGGIEPPQGEKNMGGWTSRVYTEEQQLRLQVDEFGMPLPMEAPKTKIVPISKNVQTFGPAWTHGTAVS